MKFYLYLLSKFTNKHKTLNNNNNKKNKHGYSFLKNKLKG